VFKSTFFLGALLFVVSASFFDPRAFSEGVVVVRNASDCFKDDPVEVELIEDLVLGDGKDEVSEILGMISDVCVDSDKNIYVLDYSNRRVVVYDSFGVVQRSFGRSGQGPGEFSNPLAMAMDLNDRIAVADAGKVQIFDRSGRYLRSFKVGIPGMIRDITVDGEGNYYISSFDVLKQNIIHKYDAEGDYVTSFCKSFAFGKDVDLRIESTFAGGYIALDRIGGIVFSQMIPYEIRKYSSEGELLVRIIRENKFMKAPEDYVKVKGESMEFSMPPLSSSVAVLPDGFILNTVSIPSQDENHSTTVIDVFDADGRLRSSIGSDRSLRFACMDDQSRLYAVDNSDLPMVIRYRFSWKGESGRTGRVKVKGKVE